MSVLVVDGSIVVDVARGVTLTWENMDHQRRAWSGKMRSAQHSANNRARVWTLSTAIMTVSAAETLETALTAAGDVTISGNLPGGSVTCKALNVVRQLGPASDQIILSFELHEVL